MSRVTRSLRGDIHEVVELLFHLVDINSRLAACHFKSTLAVKRRFDQEYALAANDPKMAVEVGVLARGAGCVNVVLEGESECRDRVRNLREVLMVAMCCDRITVPDEPGSVDRAKTKVHHARSVTGKAGIKLLLIGPQTTISYDMSSSEWIGSPITPAWTHSRARLITSSVCIR